MGIYFIVDLFGVLDGGFCYVYVVDGVVWWSEDYGEFWVLYEWFDYWLGSGGLCVWCWDDGIFGVIDFEGEEVRVKFDILVDVSVCWVFFDYVVVGLNDGVFVYERNSVVSWCFSYLDGKVWVFLVILVDDDVFYIFVNDGGRVVWF